MGDDGAAIELGGNEVHGTAGEAAAFVDGALVGVQAKEGGQQGGMDINGSIGEVAAKLGRENAHITDKQHKVRRVARLISALIFVNESLDYYLKILLYSYQFLLSSHL